MMESAFEQVQAQEGENRFGKIKKLSPELQEIEDELIRWCGGGTPRSTSSIEPRRIGNGKTIRRR